MKKIIQKAKIPEELTYAQKYKKEHQVEIKKARKKYYRDHKKGVLENGRIYRETNKEKTKERHKKYYGENKESILQEQREQYKDPKKRLQKLASDRKRSKLPKHREKKKLYDKQRRNNPEIIKKTKQKQVDILKQDFEGVNIDGQLLEAQKKFRKKNEPNILERIGRIIRPKQLSQVTPHKSKETIKRRISQKVWSGVVRPAMLRKKGFKCSCGTGGFEKSLHIHHDKYPTKRHPTKLKDLKVLCEICHKEEEN